MTDVRIGLVGTGFIARHFAMSLHRHEGFRLAQVLTRRPLDTIDEPFEDRATNLIDEFLSSVDVVVECSGDPLWATEIVAAAVDSRLPVVTMNTEFHITTGSAFVEHGLVTEAEGDQPGCLAALHEDAVAMGFKPIAYGNMKGFLNLEPTPEDMEHWGKKQGISLPMVTSFTDGTKVQAEQILVGNFFGATIAKEGMLSAGVGDQEEASNILSRAYEETGSPISDYVVGRALPHGVFIVATHDERHAAALAYYKLGDGPYYTLVKNNIFVHLEILKTVRRVLEQGTVLLDNSREPELSLAAVAKRDLKPGDRIESAIGSFDFRGHAVRIADHPAHVPIGLLRDVRVTTPIERGAIVNFNDLELPDSMALRLWHDIAAVSAGRPFSAG